MGKKNKNKGVKGAEAPLMWDDFFKLWTDVSSGLYYHLHVLGNLYLTTEGKIIMEEERLKKLPEPEQDKTTLNELRDEFYKYQKLFQALEKELRYAQDTCRLHMVVSDFKFEDEKCLTDLFEHPEKYFKFGKVEIDPPAVITDFDKQLEYVEKVKTEILNISTRYTNVNTNLLHYTEQIESLKIGEELVRESDQELDVSLPDDLDFDIPSEKETIDINAKNPKPQS